MSTSSRSDAIFTQLSTPGMVLVITVLFAGMARSPRYEPARPAREPGTVAAEDVGALMTEDPQAILRRLASHETRRESTLFGLRIDLESPQRHGEEPPQPPAADADLVLVVRTQDDGLLDGEERRTRSRQAVLLALLDGGYEPAGKVKYIPLPGSGERVLYESFKRAQTPKTVLVAWSQEGREEPLKHIGEVVRALGGQCRPCNLVVIGPTSTGELIRIQSEKTAALPLVGMRIHSPFATAATRFNRLEDEKRFTMTSTIGSDLDLAHLLVAELRERIPELLPLEDAFFLPGFGPRTGAESVHVAVIAEANTPYGSAWIESLRKAAGELEEAEHRVSGAHARPRLEFVLHPFVTPIDGGRMRESAADEASPVAPDYPIGASQIDYLCRLGQELRSDGQRRYAAIGIFGTDVYDTLMILEAVRPLHPHAVFFTTDLDARYLHPRHLGFTRNLIVASHHPLRVCRSEGADAAIEFRDTYQTSVYRAVQLALRPEAEYEVPRPLLHEIGNGRAVPLDPPRGVTPCGHSGPGSDAACPVRAPNAADPGDRIAAASVGGSVLVSASVAATLLVLCILWVRRAHEKQRPLWLALLAVLLWVASYAWIRERAASEDLGAQEPLGLLSGVSVWPAVLLRLAAFFYCLLAIVWIRRSVRDALTRIGRKHRLAGASVAEERKGWRCLLWLLGGLRARGPWKLEEVWALTARAFRLLWPRLTLYAVLIYIASAPLFMLTAPPPAPVRGVFAYVVERWTLGLSLIAFFMLFAYVLELTLLAACLILRLTDRHATLLPRETAAAEKWSGLDDTLDHRRRLDLVRDVTRSVERLVYFPMLAIVVFVFARSSVFDAWVWFPALVITLSTFFVLLLGCVVALRIVARNYLAGSLEDLEQLQLQHSEDEKKRHLLSGVREYLGAFRGGAFSPLLEHPIVRAVLLILLGLATTLALERRLGGGAGIW
jgi:hypothetical protein